MIKGELISLWNKVERSPQISIDHPGFPPLFAMYAESTGQSATQIDGDANFTTVLFEVDDSIYDSIYDDSNYYILTSRRVDNEP